MLIFSGFIVSDVLSTGLQISKYLLRILSLRATLTSCHQFLLTNHSILKVLRHLLLPSQSVHYYLLKLINGVLNTETQMTNCYFHLLLGQIGTYGPRHWRLWVEQFQAAVGDQAEGGPG